MKVFQSTSFGAKPSALWNSMWSPPGVSEMAAALPGAAVPDAEELFHRRTVQMACVHAAEHVENFWKSLEPCVFGRHPSASDPTQREGANRHYMISRIFLGRLYMNDKGGDFKGSMQHFT